MLLRLHMDAMISRLSMQVGRCLVLLLALLMMQSLGLAQALPDAAAADGEAEAPTATLPVDEAPSDEAIGARLRGVFERVEKFQGVQVEVDEGVVYLQGEVDRAEAREKAEAFAQRLEGVLFVANEIEVARDVEGRLTPAVVRIREFLADLLGYLPILGLALVLVLLFYGLAKLVTLSERPYRLLGVNPLLANLIRRLMFAVIVLVGMFIAIDLLDITALVGASIGAAGIIGLALGFAFQDVAENYLAGVLLSIRRPFNVGDLVRIDQHEGHIIRMTPRELVLITLDGNHVRLPNGTVFKSVIYNFSTNPRRQFQIEVGLGVNVDLAAAQQIGIQALVAVDGVLTEPPPFARVQQLAESSVTVNFFGWVDQRATGFFKARSEAIRQLKQAFDTAGIDMPVPQYDLTVHRGQPHPELPAPPMKATPAASGTAPAEPTGRAVSEEAVVEEQIRKDLANSSEENLLKGRS